MSSRSPAYRWGGLSGRCMRRAWGRPVGRDSPGPGVPVVRSGSSAGSRVPLVLGAGWTAWSSTAGLGSLSGWPGGWVSGPPPAVVPPASSPAGARGRPRSQGGGGPAPSGRRGAAVARCCPPRPDPRGWVPLRLPSTSGLAGIGGPPGSVRVLGRRTSTRGNLGPSQQGYVHSRPRRPP